MYTPFLKEVVFTSKDHPNTLSLVVFTNPLICNLDCYMCHNKREAKRMGEIYYLSTDEFFDVVREYKSLGCELLIISGGEPLMDNMLIDFLKDYRDKINLPIRVDTNGSFPDKMLEIKDLVDGFCVDIKIPMKDYYTDDEIKRIQRFLGCDVDVYQFRDNIRKSVKISLGMKYSHLRLGYVYYCIQFGVSEYMFRQLGVNPI